MRHPQRLLFVASATLATFACSWPGAGEMNDPPPDITISFVNRSTRDVYVFRADSRSDSSALEEEQYIWRLEPKEALELGAGSTAGVDGRPCLVNVQYWVVASRSGTRYTEGVGVVPAEDAEVVDHVEPGRCFDSTDVTIEIGTAA